MTYCPKPRIANSMISTARTGVPSKRAQAFHLPDGKERGELRAGRRREVLISVISNLVALAAAPEVSTSETCLAARAVPLGAVIADRMSKPNWNCLWKRRIAADGGPCSCRPLKPARRVTAPA